jgi:TonB family protein
MRALWVIALFASLGTSFSGGQQNSSSAPPSLPDAQQARVKVYAVGPGVTAPELIPPAPLPNPVGKCKNQIDGKVVLSVIVDTTGRPRNLMFLYPLGNDLDKFALQVAAADLFKPGTHDGTPVVVAQSVEVNLQACVEQKKDDAGKKIFQLRLRSQPVQKLGTLPQSPEDAVLTANGLSLEDTYNAAVPFYLVGGGVTAPVLLHHAEAEFSDEARRAKYQGVCILSMVVDAKGLPKDVRVERPLDYGLTEEAIKAVNRYRFKPAMKDGRPVPVKLKVEVDFHLY